MHYRGQLEQIPIVICARYLLSVSTHLVYRVGRLRQQHDAKMRTKKHRERSSHESRIWRHRIFCPSDQPVGWWIDLSASRPRHYYGKGEISARHHGPEIHALLRSSADNALYDHQSVLFLCPCSFASNQQLSQAAPVFCFFIDLGRYHGRRSVVVPAFHFRYCAIAWLPLDH